MADAITDLSLRLMEVIVTSSIKAQRLTGLMDSLALNQHSVAIAGNDASRNECKAALVACINTINITRVEGETLRISLVAAHKACLNDPSSQAQEFGLKTLYNFALVTLTQILEEIPNPVPLPV